MTDNLAQILKMKPSAFWTNWADIVLNKNSPLSLWFPTDRGAENPFFLSAETDTNGASLLFSEHASNAS